MYLTDLCYAPIGIWRLFYKINVCQCICCFLVKISIDLIKPFLKSIEFVCYKLNEFQCRISNFDDVLFTSRLYKVDVFLLPWKSHALNVRSDSTPMILTLIQNFAREKHFLNSKFKMLCGLVSFQIEMMWTITVRFWAVVNVNLEV